MTPTQLTLKYLRERGIPCAVAEHWNAHAKCRQDLFGIIDIVALDHGRGVIGIQATTMAHAAERFKKLVGEKAVNSRDWIRTPGAKLEVWGWRKLKKVGKRAEWVSDIREVKEEDMKVYDIKGKIMIRDNNLRPKILFIDKIKKEMVALKPTASTYNRPLWFPREIVFEFNQRLFEELNDSYLTKNKDRLATLWSEAKKWKPEES